jgi:hypothetical protein
MKSTVLPFALLLLIYAAVPAAAAEMGTSGGYDLDSLLERAEERFRFEDHDAVYLLKSSKIEITPEGGLNSTVHTVVRIASRSSIRSYADLRIPYNQDRSVFRPVKLRTWRDGRWIPDSERISETAVVYTLPHAVDGAADYSSMREVMLLHDGVELPCILETEYSILEKDGGKMPGGFEIFRQNDPALVVEYSVTAPAGTDLKFESGNGAGEPEIRDTGSDREYIWRLEEMERLGSPHIDNPSSYAPFVVWSAVPGWKELGKMVAAGFDKAASIGDALADTVSSITEFDPAAVIKARSITEYINRSVRPVHYDPGFWFPEIRSAGRVWETAYGHPLDRAALATGMFRQAGLNAVPVFISENPAAAESTAAQLAAFDMIALRLSSDGEFLGFYLPESGSFREGYNLLYGKALWNPAEGPGPSLFRGRGKESPCRYRLQITLTPGPDGGWEGTGFIDASGIFSPYGKIAGTPEGTLSFVNGLVSSFFPGASGSSFEPELFGRDAVAAGFSFRIEEMEKDDRGRVRILQGKKPAGGLIDRLPRSLNLAHGSRTSPVVLPVEMEQSILLVINTGGMEPVYLPKEEETENSTGSCRISAEREPGRVTIRREIRLNGADVPAGSWPLLRELLLRERARAGRLIILE